MPPMPCANAPSAAKLFVQLCARRSASSLAVTSTSSSSAILDILLPRRTQARASLYLGDNVASTRTASIITSRIDTRRHAVVGKKTFSSSRSLAKTLAIHNKQTDEDGNDMVLDITPRAANRLSQIMSKDKNPHLALRIQVESGGCHGFQYLMSLTSLPSTLSSSTNPSNPSPEQVAEEVVPSTTTSSTPSSPTLNEDDTIFAFSPDSQEGRDGGDLLTGPKIVLDLPSLELLKGSKVDYTMELIGSQFKIVDNPLATSSCGCGTSFDIKA
ncbi:hypothetical protein HD806DRAFT_529004 [Xylariaceae sp. AK1471]|nr:hypothetical protein HD806DRAFT_529004 [Xylariaceae sp. AK1471]